MVEVANILSSLAFLFFIRGGDGRIDKSPAKTRVQSTWIIPGLVCGYDDRFGPPSPGVVGPLPFMAFSTGMIPQAGESTRFHDGQGDLGETTRRKGGICA